MLRNASSSLLIHDCELDGSENLSSSFEEFVDSSGGSEGGLLVSRRDNYEDKIPTLESLLNNLALDKPTLFSIATTSIETGKPQSHPKFQLSPTSKRSNTISWLSSAFKWEPTEDEINFITETGSTESKPIILYATKMKLIEKLTTILDYKLMDDFLLTLEMSIDSVDFVTCLLSRLAQAFGAVEGWDSREEVDPEVVKMRGLIILQHWALTCKADAFDYKIKRIVIEGMDVIWQQSRSLLESDQRFLIKIRRLFDPRGEISITATEQSADDVMEESRSSICEFEDKIESNHDGNSGRWRDKLKLKFKEIFSGSTKLKRSNSSNSSGFSSPSFLVNSFSSDLECEDFSTVLVRERSRVLANILGILEWDVFKEIQRRELLLFPFVRESPQKLAEECPNLQRAIEHFNSMCQWFVQLILNQEVDESITILAKLIRLAVKCLIIHNYNTALQIILALQSPVISSKKEIWLSLPSWERRLAKDLAIFGSPVKNFKNVRRSLEEIYREEIPSVPFTGLFLSDLVFNWELNSDHLEGLIPVYKIHVAAKILRQFIEFQDKIHRFERELNEKERRIYSYFADVGRLGGEFI